MMEPVDFLLAYSELAVTLIGFSGIVLALQQGGAARGELKILAVSMLIGVGSLALVAALVPLVLLEAGLDEALTWRIMGLAIGLTISMGGAMRTRQARNIGSNFDEVAGLPVRLLMMLGIPAAFANVYFGEFWLLMINLVCFLLACVFIFARLLLLKRAGDER